MFDLHLNIKRWLIKRWTKDPYQPANDRLRAIFIHVPKNGGISIEEAVFGCKIGHKTARQFQAHDLKKYNEYYKFAYVRNPYDRLVSSFHFLKQGGRNPVDRAWAERNLSKIASFEDFVSHLKSPVFAKRVLACQHFCPQYNYLLDLRGRLSLNFIGKFENFAADFAQLKIELACTDVNLPHRNQSNRQLWCDYYSTEMRTIVWMLYQEDFFYFDYPQ